MGRIRSLPDDLIEKIAAGEVVERPASVVKELIENAIDAEARSITIDIREGGSRGITVIDDGVGMSREDLVTSVKRHATSKISSEEDLWRIGTMGFRGEALAATGAVSRLTIESKLNESDVIEGARIVVEGGVVGEPVVAGCAGGSLVSVLDLFYNVPARKKFLRSVAVEAGHIHDVVVAYALAYPEIRFDLSVDGNRKLNLPSATADIGGEISSDRIGAILGERAQDGLIVDESGPYVSVKGMVSVCGRRGGKDVHFYMNGRPVRDRMLMHALTQAFGERCQGAFYPAAVLWIEMDPARVDVNVHPAKREVRFSDSGAVYSFLINAVRKSLGEARVEVSSHPTCAKGDSVGGFGTMGDVRGEAASFPSVSTGQRAGVTAGTKLVPGFDGRTDDRPLITDSRLSPIGQYALSYIVCEDDDGSLVLIDQHAAHERLGFEELTSSYRNDGISQQRLLVPEHVELGETAAAYLIENAEKLATAGFEIEPFGGGTVLVKAVPEIVGSASVITLMKKLAYEFEEMGAAISLNEVMEKVFAVVACHGQVRAGDRLGSQELMRLVRDIEARDVTSCPHGRPAVVRIGRDEIEKWFKRR